MTTMAFDSLRYARRLKEAGVPESQAEVQAELMAEAFGFYADNLLTKDHFTEVLNARFAEQEAKLDSRLAQQDAILQRAIGELDAKFEKRFGRQDVAQRVNGWMLGVVILAVLLPQLRDLLS
jgi:hypothetical protein